MLNNVYNHQFDCMFNIIKEGTFQTKTEHLLTCLTVVNLFAVEINNSFSSHPPPYIPPLLESCKKVKLMFVFGPEQNVHFILLHALLLFERFRADVFFTTAILTASQRKTYMNNNELP